MEHIIAPLAVISIPCCASEKLKKGQSYQGNNSHKLQSQREVLQSCYLVNFVIFLSFLTHNSKYLSRKSLPNISTVQRGSCNKTHKWAISQHSHFHKYKHHKMSTICNSSKSKTLIKYLKLPILNLNFCEQKLCNTHCNDDSCLCILGQTIEQNTPAFFLDA